MGIVAELLATLKDDAPVTQVCIGAFATAVWSKRMGMAYTMHFVGPHVNHVPIPDAGMLTNLSCLELAQWALTPAPLRVSVGVAAMNALFEIDESRCIDLNAADVLIERARGKRVALIGHFPFVPKLRAVATQLWVFEKRPLPGDLPADEADNLIPSADIVAITGSTFVNHTIDHLLELSRDAQLVMVLGPSTPLTPLLFDYGVDIIAGTIVVEPEVALRYIREGSTFRQMKGVRRVIMMR